MKFFPNNFVHRASGIHSESGQRKPKAHMKLSLVHRKAVHPLRG